MVPSGKASSAAVESRIGASRAIAANSELLSQIFRKRTVVFIGLSSSEILGPKIRLGKLIQSFVVLPQIGRGRKTLAHQSDDELFLDRSTDEIYAERREKAGIRNRQLRILVPRRPRFAIEKPTRSSDATVRGRFI
jgi:hypothetical protein